MLESLRNDVQVFLIFFYTKGRRVQLVLTIVELLANTYILIRCNNFFSIVPKHNTEDFKEKPEAECN